MPYSVSSTQVLRMISSATMSRIATSELATPIHARPRLTLVVIRLWLGRSGGSSSVIGSGLRDRIEPADRCFRVRAVGGRVHVLPEAVADVRDPRAAPLGEPLHAVGQRAVPALGAHLGQRVEQAGGH